MESLCLSLLSLGPGILSFVEAELSVRADRPVLEEMGHFLSPPPQGKGTVTSLIVGNMEG